MDSNLSLIKALASTLNSELDSIEEESEILAENRPFDLNEKVREFEIKLIKTALIKTKGNQRQAATLLGVKTSTLHNKIKSFNINCFKLSYD